MRIFFCCTQIGSIIPPELTRLLAAAIDTERESRQVCLYGREGKTYTVENNSILLHFGGISSCYSGTTYRREENEDEAIARAPVLFNLAPSERARLRFRKGD